VLVFIIIVTRKAYGNSKEKEDKDHADEHVVETGAGRHKDVRLECIRIEDELVDEDTTM
jgi:hypothetical protein